MSVLNVRTGNTVTTDGTLLSGQSFGVAGNQNKSKSGGAKREQEIILKQNTKYIFRVTSNGAGNIVSYRAEWYEHTPKN